MLVEEGVDGAVCGLFDLSVLANLDNVRVDVLVERAEFEREQLILVVGVAVTDERPRRQRRAILEGDGLGSTNSSASTGDNSLAPQPRASALPLFPRC